MRGILVTGALVCVVAVIAHADSLTGRLANPAGHIISHPSNMSDESNAADHHLKTAEMFGAVGTVGNTLATDPGKGYIFGGDFVFGNFGGTYHSPTSPFSNPPAPYNWTAKFQFSPYFDIAEESPPVVNLTLDIPNAAYHDLKEEWREHSSGIATFFDIRLQEGWGRLTFLSRTLPPWWWVGPGYDDTFGTSARVLGGTIDLSLTAVPVPAPLPVAAWAIAALPLFAGRICRHLRTFRNSA
jgi:hypothetical protein